MLADSHIAVRAHEILARRLVNLDDAEHQTARLNALSPALPKPPACTSSGSTNTSARRSPSPDLRHDQRLEPGPGALRALTPPVSAKGSGAQGAAAQPRAACTSPMTVGNTPKGWSELFE